MTRKACLAVHELLPVVFACVLSVNLDAGTGHVLHADVELRMVLGTVLQ